MFSSRNKVEIENSRPASGESEDGSGGPSRSLNFFQPDMCRSPNFRGASKTPHRPARVRKENSNEQTWDYDGICFYFRWRSADCGMCQAVPPGKRALRVRGHKYWLAVLARGGGRI